MTTAPQTNIRVAIPAGAPAGAPSQAPPGQAPAPATIRGSGQGLASVVRRLVAGTPGRMRLLALLGVVSVLALGGSAVNALISSEGAAERAANNTQQVVRAQSMQVNLLRADALATNAFLVGGLEDPASRARYDRAMTSVADNIARAAAAQPADGEALGALSAYVQTYAALVEQARSNNRLGLPVGAQYVTQASAGLRADAIPVISAIVTANEQRAQLEFDRSNASGLLLVGVAGVVVLGLIAVWLARRTHRYLNPSLAGAILLGILALFFSSTTIGTMGRTAQDVATGDYRKALQLARVGTSANDARANESLTLIRRGSGASNEAAWKAQDKAVLEGLKQLDSSSRLERLWATYTAAHAQVRDLDGNGDWDGAVELATSEQKDGTTTTFAAFDTEVSSMRDTASTAAIDKLSGIGGGTPWAVVIGLASLVAAWLVVRGIGQRIEEYR